MSKFKLTLIICILDLFVIHCNCACESIDKRRAIDYRLIKSNAQSAEAIMTRKSLSNANKCKDFAEHKGALAFNYERLLSDDSFGRNCILLYCPETQGTRHLKNITGIDYYSSYSKSTYQVVGKNTSLSCIEKVGLFAVIREEKNFTDAQDACKKIGGILADVTTERRSNGISGISGGGPVVLVGLSSHADNRVWRNEYGEPLSCSEYRAWDQGEPSHSRGCVGLRSLTKFQAIWQVLPCSTKLPFVCEIPRIRIKERINNTNNTNSMD